LYKKKLLPLPIGHGKKIYEVKAMKDWKIGRKPSLSWWKYIG